MLATVRAAKGQGSGSLYVRVRDATARYWDFQSGSWSATETSGSRVFLVEYPDSDTLESRYQTVVATPVSSTQVVEYVQASNGRVIAEEGDGYVTSPLQRTVALLGANRVVDLEVLDSNKRVSTARMRVYDTAAHASASGTLGLLATYTVSASYGGTGETTLVVTEVLP